ncbi:TPA: hypothetical protein ACOVFI_001539 [Citrobacter braakii]
MSGFYINTSDLRAIQAALGATQKQMTMAWNRALRDTLSSLRVRSVSVMFEKTGAKKKTSVTRRIKTFSRKGAANSPAGGKVWFGLDGMPVSALDGEISNAAERSRERDPRGRFVKMSESGGATFKPKSSAIGEMTYPGAFVATFRGRTSIFTRAPGKPHLIEVKVKIDNAITKAINDELFIGAEVMLLDKYQKELQRLVEAGIK